MCFQPWTYFSILSTLNTVIVVSFQLLQSIVINDKVVVADQAAITLQFLLLVYTKLIIIRGLPWMLYASKESTEKHQEATPLQLLPLGAVYKFSRKQLPSRFWVLLYKDLEQEDAAPLQDLHPAVPAVRAQQQYTTPLQDLCASHTAVMTFPDKDWLAFLGKTIWRKALVLL